MEINSESIFVLLIAVIIFNFIKDYFLDYLNSKNFENKIPSLISDVYDKEKYLNVYIIEEISLLLTTVFLVGLD